MLRRRLRALCLAILAAAALSGAPGATDPPPLTYVVTYDAPPTAAQVEALWGVALQVHPYQHLPAAVAVIPPGALGLLANLPGVRGVYPNRVLHTVLAQSTRTIHADGVWADGYTGAGIGIAVIDAGIDGSHPDLCAAAEFCNGTPVKTVQNVKILGDQQDGLDPVVILENQISTDSTSGHGSHVAGIAAGWGSASQTPGKYKGVAYGARLIGLGTGEVLEVVTVLAGFDWVLGHKDDPRYNIKVINNSWGPGAGTPYDPTDPVQRAIGAAYDAGLAVVFGAGNDGPKTDTLNAFSANPKAISAAGGSKAGHIALFSSRGVPGSPRWQPTVTTPGQFIASVRARTGFYADVADASGPDPSNPILPPDDLSYAYASGTSMAAPHVAGVVALMQEAAQRNLNRYLTPQEVRNVLQNTAVSLDPSRGPGGLPDYQGYTMGAGYVDALAAVRAVAAGAQLGAYAPHTLDDVRAFTGAIGPSDLVTTSSFETTYEVRPGAISLDVMIDWQHAAQNAALQDLDIDLYRPDGSLDLSTTLHLDTAEGPNQYSSLYTSQPNERVNVNFPGPGTWRAVVHGTVSVAETVYGLWSTVYPDDTLLSAAPPAAHVAVAAPALPGVAGQAATVTAAVTDAAGQPVPNAPVFWSSRGVGQVLSGETVTNARGLATAQVRADEPGTQSVTAQSGMAAGIGTLTWIGLPAVSPAPASTPGRAAGGGFFDDPARRHFAFYAEYDAQASAPGGDLSYDDHAGTAVKATAIGSLAISGNQATVTGEASVNGVGGYRFQLDATDNGEPGRNDTVRLAVTDPLNPLYRYETSGTLAGGNVQVRAY